jgi:hypothetical protein
MSENEIQSFAVALQIALRSQTPPIRLSRSASIAESSFIVPVFNGLRVACLLSVLTASQGTLAALQIALHQVQVKGVLVAVHEPSQQIFIVNRSLFAKRWCDVSRRDLFYCIDADDRGEPERIQVSARLEAFFSAYTDCLSDQHTSISLPATIGAVCEDGGKFHRSSCLGQRHWCIIGIFSSRHRSCRLAP